MKKGNTTFAELTAEELEILGLYAVYLDDQMVAGRTSNHTSSGRIRQKLEEVQWKFGANSLGETLKIARERGYIRSII